jgi:hypothetical protein
MDMMFLLQLASIADSRAQSAMSGAGRSMPSFFILN